MTANGFFKFILASLVAGAIFTVSLVSRAETPMSAAELLQDAFTSVADRASPAVVVITNKQVLGHGARMPHGIPPEFRFFFGLPESPSQPPSRSPQVPQPVGKGSGVILSPDGYIVTNYHVIKGYDALEVKLHNGRVFDSTRPDEVEVVGHDEDTDLAVLRIGNGELDELPSLEFGDSDKVRVGHWAIAVGAPFNLDYSVTVGVVSQKGRYDVRMNTYENYIQTDASINPGNSGGPLLNLSGEVIGINNFIVTGGGMSRGNVGIGFAISSNLVRQVVDDLIESGRVIRPWMGIAMQPMDDQLRRQFNVDHGVLVSDVMEGDPAEQAGLKPGDVILEIGGRPMNSTHDIQFAVLRYQPGEEIPVVVDRQGEQMTFRVVLRQRGAAAEASGLADERDMLDELGLLLDENDDQVVVAGVAAGGRAAVAGLARGDIILEVNRQAVSSVDEVLGALRETKGNVALFRRERRGMRQFVPIKIRD